MTDPADTLRSLIAEQPVSLQQPSEDALRVLLDDRHRQRARLQAQAALLPGDRLTLAYDENEIDRLMVYLSNDAAGLSSVELGPIYTDAAACAECMNADLGEDEIEALLSHYDAPDLDTVAERLEPAIRAMELLCDENPRFTLSRDPAG